MARELRDLTPKQEIPMDPGEADPTWTEWLLESIRKVKRQKQRPDVNRIFASIRNIWDNGIKKEKMIEQLEAAVLAGAIFKIFNRDGYTYKDPEMASLVALKTLQVGRKTNLSKMICKALKELHESAGSTVKSIEKRLYASYAVQVEEGVDFSRQVRISLKRAVRIGLIEADGRTFKLIGGSSTGSSTLQPETVEDKAAKPGKTPAKPLLVCSFCIGDEEKNREGEPEGLISCVDCGNSGHPSCLKFSAELAARVGKLQWQCIECKLCSLCGQTGREDNMLFCDDCDRGFHMECFMPPIKVAPQGRWICPICDPCKAPSRLKRFSRLGKPRKDEGLPRK